MRDYVGEFAAIPEDANKKIMLASLGAGKQTSAAHPISSESDPIAPRQFRPGHTAFIPMQDDRVVGLPFIFVSTFEREKSNSTLLDDEGPPMTCSTVNNRA